MVLAVDAKVLMQDMISGQAREAPRPLWGNKDPTALGFLYANAARLLGFDGGSNGNEVILGPVLAVGTSGGATTLLNFITLQAPPTAPRPCSVPLLTPDATSTTLTWRASTWVAGAGRVPSSRNRSAGSGMCSASGSIAMEAM